MEWVHCNCCYSSPSSGQSPFYFSSCGHLFCNKCVKSEAAPITPTNSDKCKVCKKKCSYLEINRSLKQEIQMYFRNPRELVGQYMQNLKSVIEFQTFHRTRFQKHQQEKANKAVKYVKMCQNEMMKRAELERCVLAERNQLKIELEKKQENMKNLETLIAERDRELFQLRQKLTTKSKRLMDRVNVNVFPSLNGATPINTLSFLGCATSTPINTMQTMFKEIDSNTKINPSVSAARMEKNAGEFGDMFGANPDEFESPISAGGNGFMNTPAMLGLCKTEKRMRSSSENSRTVKGNFF